MLPYQVLILQNKAVFLYGINLNSSLQSSALIHLKLPDIVKQSTCLLFYEYSLTSPYRQLSITAVRLVPEMPKIIHSLPLWCGHRCKADTWFCPFGVRIKEVCLYFNDGKVTSFSLTLCSEQHTSGLSYSYCNIRSSSYWTFLYKPKEIFSSQVVRFFKQHSFAQIWIVHRFKGIAFRTDVYI